MRRTSPLQDFVGIGGASTPDELWRWLVLHPNATPANLAWNAVSAFKRVHATNRDEALQTASLLCTDRRWRRITGRLIAEIEDTNMLDDDGLDRLAEDFLMMDAYAWRIPPSWLRGKVVRLAGGHRGKRMVYLDRPVATPLRRWAARRISARHPSSVAAILTRLDTLPSRDRDAVMVGLLDASPQYPEEARETLISAACEWPGGSVRWRALRLLADAGRHEKVRFRAMRDPSAKIRSWGEKHAKYAPAPQQTRLEAQARGDEAMDADLAALQPSLFPDPSACGSPDSSR
jgi:hypothetical protein